jgi:hypothetical protein
MIRHPREVVKALPTHMVNLDALIHREDFTVSVDPQKKHSLDEATKMKIVEIEAGSLMFKWLRKPDFQRTTAHWPPSKVAGFIESFVSGDLIPALILWQSDTSGIFVIDGAHRLSALIAWVHDDYGDGGISLPFFEGTIPPEQKAAADQTRVIVAARIGSYNDIKHGSNLTPQRARFASNLAAGGVTLQWVRGDASRAERSFHTINTEQTPIGDLEVRLIRDRRCANAIATRALVGAGTGRYSPSSFSEETKAAIKTIAKNTYDSLFVPPLQTPIKTLDLPVAGRGYSQETVKLILDFVEFVNSQPSQSPSSPDYVKKPRKRRGEKTDILAPTMDVDEDGFRTVEFLENVRKAAFRIAGMKPESLGLHPAVYFYSATGNYQPTAFLAAIRLVQEFESRHELNLFTQHRKAFEELLVRHKYLINQIVRKFGAGTRSLNAVSRLYRHIFEGVSAGKDETAIIPTIVQVERMEFLKPIVDFDKGIKQDFSTERKSAIFLTEALKQSLRCGICGARLHRNSLNFDHTNDKQFGGVGSEENAAMTHPYCNSTYKSWLREREGAAAAGS